MTAHGFTAGPWSVGEPDENGLPIWSRDAYNAYRTHIADVSFSEKTAAEMEEIARLIASAPDLLAALERAEARLRYLSITYGKKIDADLVYDTKQAIAAAAGSRG